MSDLPRNINIKKLKDELAPKHTDEKDLEQKRLEKARKRVEKRRQSRLFVFMKKTAETFNLKRSVAFLRRKKNEFLKIAYKENKHKVKTVYIRNTNYAYRAAFFVKHAAKVAAMTVAGIVKICLPVLLPLLAVAIIFFSAFFVARYSLALQVVMNETPMEVYVQNEEDLSRIRTQVSATIREEQHGEYAVEQFASLKVVLVERSKLSTEQDVYNAIYDVSEEATKQSYGIYADKVFIGCLTRLAEVNQLEADVLAAYIGQTETVEAKLLGTIEYKRGEYDRQYDMSYSEMLDYFTKKTADQTAYVHPLSYEIVKKETTTTRLPCGEAVEVEDPSLYEGFRKAETVGSDGYVTSEIMITLQNGVEVKREATVLSKKDPVQGTIRVGTKKIAPSGYFLWPVGGGGGYVSSPFGFRTLYGNYAFHRGLDIAADYGTNIYAAEAGTVIFFGWDTGGLGNCVRIDHGNGIYTSYGHCSALASGIKVGQRVPQGQLIAYVGKSGSATGSHLHFAMTTSTDFASNSSYIDPLKYLTK